MRTALLFVSHMARKSAQLKSARAFAGLSQLDTALAAKIKHYRYLRIENGYETATAEEQAALAVVLDVDVAALFPDAESSGGAEGHREIRRAESHS